MTSQELKTKIAKDHAVGFFLCFTDNNNPLRDYDRFMEYTEDKDDDDDFPNGIYPDLPFEGHNLVSLRDLIETHATYLEDIMTEFEKGK